MVEDDIPRRKTREPPRPGSAAELAELSEQDTGDKSAGR